jgi:hypothetical protein
VACLVVGLLQIGSRPFTTINYNIVVHQQLLYRPEFGEISSYANRKGLKKIHSYPGVSYVHQTIHSLQAVQNTISDQNGVYMSVGKAEYQKSKLIAEFDVHMSLHRKYISKVQPTRCNVFSIYLFL